MMPDRYAQFSRTTAAVNDPHEPLELSAPLAWILATQLCCEDPAKRESCSWHHGFWQYLRLMGLAVTPADQADFYRRAVHSVTYDTGKPRILISGTTDYSMLAHVMAIYRAQRIEPALVVLDICETSLFLNRWYAHRISADVECVRSDILDYTSDTPFDAVCTDSFLGQFSPDGRIRLLKKWWQLLRIGGRVVTVTRIRETADSAQIGFSPDQAQALRDSVARTCASKPPWLQLDPAEIVRAADLYASKQRTWPVRSREEVQQLFESCGFSLDELSGASRASDTLCKPVGQASPGNGEQACVIATRL